MSKSPRTNRTQEKLLSINEAVAQGITRVRKPVWAEPLDQLHIGPGIWMHLYCPSNKEINGRDPVDIMKICCDMDEKAWLPHTWPGPESDDYKAMAAQFGGVLNK